MHAWETRLSQSNVVVETFEREKKKGGCTNIHILDILAIIFTKIVECYSAPYGLHNLINVKSLFSVANVGRNSKQQHQKLRDQHDSDQTKKIRKHLFR